MMHHSGFVHVFTNQITFRAVIEILIDLFSFLAVGVSIGHPSSAFVEEDRLYKYKIARRKRTVKDAAIFLWLQQKRVKEIVQIIIYT